MTKEELTTAITAAYARIERLEAALKVARHGLVTTNNLRATDQTEEIFEAHLDNGVPRENLEWVTDNSKEIAVVDAALEDKANAS